MSNKVIEMPISIAGKHGVIRAAITRGQGPLLLSRPGLKRLQARLDFDKDELVLFDEGIRAPLRVNEAGQYVVPVLGQRAAEDEEHLKLIPGENNVEPTDKVPASPTSSSDSPAPGASGCNVVGLLGVARGSACASSCATPHLFVLPQRSFRLSSAFAADQAYA